MSVDGKSIGATRERAIVRKTKRWCRKRMCWYATRCGKMMWSRVCGAGEIAGSGNADVKEEEAMGEGLRIRLTSETRMDR